MITLTSFVKMLRFFYNFSKLHKISSPTDNWLCDLQQEAFDFKNIACVLYNGPFAIKVVLMFSTTA